MKVILDSEALSALSRRDRAAHSLLAGIDAEDELAVIPAVILAEVMTGKPSDAAVWHVVDRLVVCHTTASIAARAGALRQGAESVRRKKRDLTIDAIVAATAEALAPSVVVTGDPTDFALLLSPSRIPVIPLHR